MINQVFRTSQNNTYAKYAKLRVAHAPGMPGTVSPPTGVTDPDKRFPLKSVVCKTFPANPQPAILRIW